MFKEFHYEKEFFLIQLNLAIKIAEASFDIIKDLHSKIYEVIKYDTNKIIKGFEVMRKLSHNDKDKRNYEAEIKKLTNILNKLKNS